MFCKTTHKSPEGKRNSIPLEFGLRKQIFFLSNSYSKKTKSHFLAKCFMRFLNGPFILFWNGFWVSESCDVWNGKVGLEDWIDSLLKKLFRTFQLIIRKILGKTRIRKLAHWISAKISVIWFESKMLILHLVKNQFEFLWKLCYGKKMFYLKSFLSKWINFFIKNLEKMHSALGVIYPPYADL